MVRRVVAVGWRRTRAVGAYAAGISANRFLSDFANATADTPTPKRLRVSVHYVPCHPKPEA